MRDLTRKPHLPAVTHLAATSLVALILAGGIVTQAAADVTTCISQPPALAGWVSVMVTFDPSSELCDQAPSGAPCGTTPFTYRGVDYETPSTDWMSFVFDVGIPVVRHLTAPLLATVCDTDMGDCGFMSLELVFEDPTPFFGFGYGYNDLNQPQDGKSVRKIGQVTLYNEYGRTIHRTNLDASRLYCCTEGRFDFRAKGKGTRRFVKTAVIEFAHDYTPFLPGVSPPEEGQIKFFGIDNVSYATPFDVSEVCPPEAQ